MNPLTQQLTQQIAIGAGALLLGFLIGTLLAGRRTRSARAAGRTKAEGLTEQIAVKRIRIRGLEERLSNAKDPKAPIDSLPASYQQIIPKAPDGPVWLATPPDPTPDSAPPRV